MDATPPPGPLGAGHLACWPRENGDSLPESPQDVGLYWGLLFPAELLRLAGRGDEADGLAALRAGGFSSEEEARRIAAALEAVDGGWCGMGVLPGELLEFSGEVISGRMLPAPHHVVVAAASRAARRILGWTSDRGEVVAAALRNLLLPQFRVEAARLGWAWDEPPTRMGYLRVRPPNGSEQHPHAAHWTPWAVWLGPAVECPAWERRCLSREDGRLCRPCMKRGDLRRPWAAPPWVPSR